MKKKMEKNNELRFFFVLEICTPERCVYLPIQFILYDFLLMAKFQCIFHMNGDLEPNNKMQ